MDMDFLDTLDELNKPKVEKYPWMDEVRMELVTDETLSKVIDECIESGLYALDLETTGLDNRVFYGDNGKPTMPYAQIVGYCLSPDGEVGYYIPVRHKDSDGVPHKANISASKAASEMRRLVDSDAVAIFHNGKFDQEFLQFGEGEPIGEWDSPSKWEDTLILAYLRNSRQRQKSLKYLSNTELQMEMIELDQLFSEDQKREMGKGYLNFSLLDPDWEPVVWYAASDAICTYRLFKLLHPQVMDPAPIGKNQSDVYTIEKMTIAATRWMERNRINIDRDKIEELIYLGQQEWFESLTEVFEGASDLLGRDIRPGWFRIMQGEEGSAKFNPRVMKPGYMEVREEARRQAATLRLDPTVTDARGKEKVRTLPKEVQHLQDKRKRETVNFPEVYDVTIPRELGLLLRELGVEGLRPTESSGQVKTSKDEINRVLEHAEADFPFMSKVARFRETAKALGSNLFPIYHDTSKERSPDGTIKVGFNGTKVDTGRFATPSPSKKRGFHGQVRWNLHSIPATYDKTKPACMLRMREAVKARPGYKLFACVAEGSLISTHRGLVPIEDVQAGDRVVTENGLKTVSRAAKTGHRDVVKVTTSKGYSVRVTPDHRVWTTSPEGMVWKQAGDLRPGDWVVSISGTGDGEACPLPPTPEVSPKEKPITTPATLDNEVARFLGRFMGDGCIGHDHGKMRYVGFALGDDVSDVLPSHNEVAHHLFNLTFTETSKGDVHCWSQPLCRWLEDITGKGTADVRSYRVPPVVRTSPAVWGAFLSGLFDADGSVGSRPGDGVTLWVSSEVFAAEVQAMLLGLGVPCRRNFSVRENNFGTNDGWLLSVTGIRPLRQFHNRVGMASTRKCAALENLIRAGRNRDLSNFIPLDLARKAILPGAPSKVGVCVRNGERAGRVTYEAMETRRESSKGVDSEWMSRLLDGPLLFDTVESVEQDGDADVYDITVPDAGYFVANGITVHNCDYAGVELRIVTNLSREHLWLDEFFRCSNCDKKFERDEAPPHFCPDCGSDKIGDLHTLTALSIYGDHIKGTKQFKNKRQKAKSLNFAMAYGGGGNAAMRAVGVDRDEGWRIKRQFDGTYKGLQKWWSIQHNFARKYKFVTTAFGRRYPLPDIDHEMGGFRAKAERNATNGPIQGTSADITKLAMALIHKECKKRGWIRLVLMTITIHDELVFEIHESIVEEAVKVIEECMCRNSVLRKLRDPVFYKVDMEFGDDWTVPYNLTEMAHNQGGGEWTPDLANMFPKSYASYLSHGGTPIEDYTPKEAVDEGGQDSEDSSTSSPDPQPPKDQFQAHPTGKNVEFVYTIDTDRYSYALVANLARIIHKCQGRGTAKLRIRNEKGVDLLDADMEIRVSPAQFQALADDYKV